MKIDDVTLFEFDPPLTPTSEIRCSACGAWSALSAWREDADAVYCEDCGSHSGVICPECGEAHDVVYSKPLETRHQQGNVGD